MSPLLTQVTQPQWGLVHCLQPYQKLPSWSFLGLKSLEPGGSKRERGVLWGWIGRTPLATFKAWAFTEMESGQD